MARLLVRRGCPPPAVHRHAPAGRDPARLRQALEHHPRRRDRALSADVEERAGAARARPPAAPYRRMFSNVQVLRLAHPPAERTFYLVTPKGRALSAAAETLLEDLRVQIQDLEGITWY